MVNAVVDTRPSSSARVLSAVEANELLTSLRTQNPLFCVGSYSKP